VRRFAWLLLLCSAPAARAYERSRNSGGVCIWWTTHGHSFQIDAQGTTDAPTSETYDAIRKSYQTWSGIACSDLNFPEEPLSTSASDRFVGFVETGTNHNLVLFRSRSCPQVVPAGDNCRTQGGCGNKYDCWENGDGVIATTTTTTSRSTGEIFDTDIELNDSPASNGSRFTFTTVTSLPCTSPGETGCVRIDVQNTVTHEAGHTIGLDHTSDPNATMFASAPSGEISKRKLGADDIAGVCAIYPAGQASVKTCSGGSSPPSDSGGCGCSKAQTGPGAALGALALALFLQIRRRSRRRPQLPISSSTKPATAARFQSGSEN
jgi:MYXO-CTERM domain-containing protein